MAMTMYTQILIRTPGSPLPLLRSVSAAVNSVDHDQQTQGDVKDLEHWITRLPDYARGQLVSWLFGGFAFLALVLAAVGLYSVVSYTVAQRTNEIGIRLALGAPREHVLRIVFNSTALSVGVGVAAGIGLTLALNRVMASWEAESSRDPLLLFAATCALSLVASVACAVPAWRAARVSPMTAIRYE
jgi:ABC-type antimicrobial peptide transport system permease subunit